MTRGLSGEMFEKILLQNICNEIFLYIFRNPPWYSGQCCRLSRWKPGFNSPARQILSHERAYERKGMSTVEWFIWMNLYSLDLICKKLCSQGFEPEILASAAQRLVHIKQISLLRERVWNKRCHGPISYLPCIQLTRSWCTTYKDDISYSKSALALVSKTVTQKITIE